MTPQEIESLKAERDALAAHVKLMADTLKNFHPDRFEYQENDFDLGDDVVEVLSKTPQECLLDIQAESNALTSKNHQLLAVLSDIQQQCIGAIAMSYPMSPEHIGQQIYQATGMTEPELRATVRQGGVE